MKEKNYTQKLLLWCEKVCNVFGWNFEKEIEEWTQNKTRILKADEKLKRSIYKAINEAEQYYGRNIVALYDNIFVNSGWSSGFIDALRFKSVDDFSEENLKEKIDYANLIKELIDLYGSWEKEEFSELIEKLAISAKFKDNNFRLHPSILEEINKIVIGRKFNLYKYHDTGEKLERDDIFHLSPKIGFSEDLTLWLDYIRNQSEFLRARPRNELYVTLFGKLDDVNPIYSNWIFTIHKKDTIWILTDQVNLDNPYQKTARLSRMGLYRDRYEHQDSCDLPFYLFENIDELRARYGNGLIKQNQKAVKTRFPDTIKKYEDFHFVNQWFEEEIAGLVNYDIIYSEDRNPNSCIRDYRRVFAKKSGRIVAYWEKDMENIVFPTTPEVFVMPTDDLKDGEKAFVLLLINEIIQFHSSLGVDHKTLLLARDYAQSKLIENAEISPLKTTSLKYWGEEAQQVFNEIYDTLSDMESGSEFSSKLVPVGYNMVINNKSFNENWLTTEDKLHSLSEWMVVDEEKERIENKIKLLGKEKEKSEVELYKLFQSKFKIILEKIQFSRHIKFKIKNTRNSSEKISSSGGFIKPTGEIKGVDVYRGYGIGKRYDEDKRWNYWYEDYCHCCGNVKSKNMHLISFSNYKEIMWLLDIKDRKELPLYYRNYRTSVLIPYNGNSLLDQTHPFNRIKDPCSKENPNRITIRVFMCKRCYGKLDFKNEELEIEIDL